MNMGIKILTLLIVSIILYFGMIIAYEHPLGSITGFISSDSAVGSGISDYVSFLILSIIMFSLFFVAWRRHQSFKKRKT